MGAKKQMVDWSTLDPKSSVPMTRIAELENVSADQVHRRAAEDPDHPKLISFSPNNRAQKYVIWGEYLAYRERLKERTVGRRRTSEPASTAA